ncbi:hypothetical protein L1987_72303 [Smallanthus sonchifolius]|uniref:Uncharacterized protein n=1 Tax=Smallanthus sonchifolius TaxID=185202 RepID=A0ACB9AU97_9ASTR|nr:hypothetical protein L1987_72303 [Smallanthus sonchifolius]
MNQITHRVAITRQNLPPRLPTRTTYKYVKAYSCIINCTFSLYIFPIWEKSTTTPSTQTLPGPFIFKNPSLNTHR